MKVWVFEKKDGRKLMVTEEGSRIKIMEKDVAHGVVKSHWSEWSVIDDMKANDGLLYLSTFRTFHDIPAIVFFDLDRSVWCEQ